MGSGSTRSRRTWTAAALVLLGVAILRALTLDLPAERRGIEVAASAAALLWAAAGTQARDRWGARDPLVVAVGLVGALLVGTMAYAARDRFGSIAVPVALLVAVLPATLPARASRRSLVLVTVGVDAVLAATLVAWSGQDAVAIVVTVGLVVGAQLALLAVARQAAAAAESGDVRSVAHANTAERVGTAIDLLSVSRAVLENARSTYPVTTEAFLMLYDSAASRLRPLPLYLGPSGIGPLDADNLDFGLAPHEGLAGKVFASTRPILWPTAFDVEMAMANVNEEVRRQRALLRRAPLLAAIGAPLMIDDEVIGSFVLSTSRHELAWAEDDLTVVSALAAEAARAIERARRYERELDQAHLDSITGLASHRQLIRTLDQEVARARRRENSLGVLFCDLDRFKAVNDTYGHAAGDRVLTILARVFHASLRREDSAARYGGDEFVCVLPSADRAEADAVGRRVSEGFAARVREDVQLQSAGVTISCGVAIFPDDGDGVEELLNNADTAMRVVKARHRLSSLSTR